MEIKFRQIISIITILIFNQITIFGQQQIRSIISTEYNHFIAKLDNPFRVVAQQEKPVTIDQLSAIIQIYDSEEQPIEIQKRGNYFIIHPDTIGILEIRIDLRDTIEIKRIRVKAIEAKGRLGRFGANTNESIKKGEFRAQQGIAAIIEGYDIDASCKIYGYEILRISKRNEVERKINKGGRFEEESKLLINKAESGDLYIFREITYRCPGSNKIERLLDMIFEIE